MIFPNKYVPYKRLQELHKWLPLRRRRTEWDLWMRRYHKPLAYILKSQPFLGHSIRVVPPVLIPREETEYWVGGVLEVIPHGLRILELCTGSGCIAAALAHKCHSIVAVDKCPMAVRLAIRNTQKFKNVKVISVDLFDDEWIKECAGSFDLIISNPPYLPRTTRLPTSVKVWEDGAALFGGSHGTLFHERILNIAPKLLCKKTELEYNVLMETDSRLEQRKELTRILQEKKGVKEFVFERDQFQRWRTLKCKVSTCN